MLSSGFTNAPVTKCALISIIVTSMAASVFDVKYLFYIDVVPHLWTYWQFWRLFIWQTCYLNSTEVLQACMILYSMRVIERLWGSRKFASFIISTLPYTSLLPPLLLALIVRPLSLNNLNYLPAGPTAIVFAILAQYHAAIPSTYKYHITTGPSSSSSSSSPSSASSTSPSLSPLTLRLTDKSTIYFLALQLSLSQFPHSILPALSGWIIGHAWRAELLPGNAASWRVPGWVYGGDTASDLRRRVLTGAAGSGAAAARYEGLRRRLEGESRAATATATAAGRQGGEGTGSGSGAETGQRPLAGQILDQFRGRF